jgi:hypothetical protein
MPKSLPKNFDWIFLSILSLAGIGLVFLATSKYGAGVAGDSIHYLSVAANLLKGRGFIDYVDTPLIWFPPLLSVLIAGLSWPFQADVLTVSGVLNACLWGLNIFLSGYFLHRVFAERPIYFYLSSLIIFLSPSALAMHASVLSDPLFLTFTLLFFIAGESYLIKPGWKSFFGMFILAILAPLLRYSGFTHIVTGGLIILWAHGRKLLKSLPLAAFFGLLTLLPSALWIYLHNYQVSGSWWGGSTTAGADLTVNILQSLRKMLYWFIPYRPISANGFAEPVILLAVLLVILVLINKKQDWFNFGKECLRPALVSTILLTGVYFSSLVLNMQTGDHRVLFSDRYVVIIFLPVLVLIFLVFDRLILPHLRFSVRQIQAGLVVCFLLWSVYPVYKIYKYIGVSLTQGESGYNQYNTRTYRESEIMLKVEKLLAKEPQARLYSNISPVVWLLTRHTMTLPPAQDVERTKDQIKTEFAGWPHDKPGYYVWFEPDPFELFMPLDDLSLVADMEVVEKASDGMIVRVWARDGQ